jgi:DNA-binding NarL/FixJ family response regulator
MLAAREPQAQSYLLKRSILAKRLAETCPFKRFTIIDDTLFDADVLAGGLRKVLGREIHVEIARNIHTLHKLWEVAKPDLCFLDDRLGHMGSASTHLPALRRMGYREHIVVVSGLMSRDRRALLMQLGAAEALHKDDLDTGRLIELLLQMTDRPSGPAV